MNTCMWNSIRSKAFVAAFALMFFAMTAYAQAAGVPKKPGDPITFAWNYSITDQANVTGYKLYSGLSATGPFNFTGVITTTPAVLTLTNPAAFVVGSTATWYTMRAYFTGTVPTPMTVESPDSNSVEVDRAVVTPTVLTAR